MWARRGDVVTMPIWSPDHVLRGLNGLKPRVQPCGVDLLDRTGETVGRDIDLHKEGEVLKEVLVALYHRLLMDKSVRRRGYIFLPMSIRRTTPARRRVIRALKQVS